MQNDDAILTAALREIFGLDEDNYTVGSIRPPRGDFHDARNPFFVFAPVQQNSQRFRPADMMLAPRQENKEPPAPNGNLEMANKINELYNELNQKDKDLKEARETIARLQQNILDFRKRAENAEMNARHTLAAHNELSANFNGLVEKYNKLKLDHQAVNDKVEYLLKRIKNEQEGLAYSYDPAIKGGDQHKEYTSPVDAISIPLSEAEEIINKFRGV